MSQKGFLEKFKTFKNFCNLEFSQFYEKSVPIFSILPKLQNKFYENEVNEQLFMYKKFVMMDEHQISFVTDFIFFVGEEAIFAIILAEMKNRESKKYFFFFFLNF